MSRRKLLGAAAVAALLTAAGTAVLRSTAATQDDDNWGRSVPVVNADIFAHLDVRAWRFEVHPKAKKVTLGLVEDAQAKESRVVLDLPQRPADGHNKVLVVVSFERGPQPESRRVSFRLHVEGNPTIPTKTFNQPVRNGWTGWHGQVPSVVRSRNVLLEFREGFPGRPDNTFAEFVFEVE